MTTIICRKCKGTLQQGPTRDVRYVLCDECVESEPLGEAVKKAIEAITALTERIKKLEERNKYLNREISHLKPPIDRCP